MANDECYTPKWVFEALNLEFDVDVAAPKTETNVPAKNKYTIEDDGLIQSWIGLVWMNPPYSGPKLWVQKFIQHGNGIALLPMTKAKWLQELWNSNAQSVLLPTNLTFVNNGYDKKQIQYQCALWAMGDVAINALHGFDVKVR